MTLVACRSTAIPQDARAAQIQWGYSGTEGPRHWGELSEDFAPCTDGQEQSPINIDNPTKADLADIVFNYRPSALNIVNNGASVQVNYDPGSSIAWDGAVYQLVQFHFHTPSEHTVKGKTYALELHLVHRSAEGKLAVVGVLVDIGAENPAFASIWDHLPSEAGAEQIVEGVTINAGDLLPQTKSYFTYDGSLTTPPCTEGVKWFVLTNPLANVASTDRSHCPNHG